MCQVDLAKVKHPKYRVRDSNQDYFPIHVDSSIFNDFAREFNMMVNKQFDSKVYEAFANIGYDETTVRQMILDDRIKIFYQTYSYNETSLIFRIDNRMVFAVTKVITFDYERHTVDLDIDITYFNKE